MKTKLQKVFFDFTFHPFTFSLKILILQYLAVKRLLLHLFTIFSPFTFFKNKPRFSCPLPENKVFTLQGKLINTEKIMEYAELARLYTELREHCRALYRERADWNILFGKCRNLEIENEALKAELKYNDELIKKGLYNDFNHVIKEKEEKFENEFPPIEE